MRRTWLACATLALTLPTGAARADMFKPSIQQQIQLGQEYATKIRREEGVLRDTDPRVRTLRRIGNSLLAQIPASERDKKPFQYTFDIVNKSDVNAFALPGGPIFIYRGLFDRLQTEDQLAGVLAHEIAHVRFEHWASAYADNQKRKLGLNILLLLFNANETAFNVAHVTDDLVFTLPYSRRHETDSDKSGYDLMVKADFNPQGMADVFRVLKSASGSGRVAEWASTHPDIDRRIRNIEARVEASGTNYPPQTRLGGATLTRSYISSKLALPQVN